MNTKTLAILTMVTLALTLPLASASDWTQFHYDIANTGNSPANAPDTNQVKWISENISAAECSQAIIVGDQVFAYISAADVDDAIYALNRATGSVEWSTTFPGETKDWGSSTTPAYSDGVVFAAAGYNVTRFDAATGTKLQEIAFPDGGYLSNGGVTVADGMAFVGSGSGANYYALNASDLDDVIWNYTTALSRAYSTPAVADDLVVFGDAGWGYDDGYLYCVDEFTGAEDWSTGLTGLVWGSATIDAANNRVYVATAVDWTNDEGKLYALAFDTGAVQWSADINYTSSTPAVSGAYIYVAASGTAPGVTYCFDSSGVEQWNVPSGSRKISPAVADGKLFTGDIGLSGMASEGTEGINVYDATTGALVWQYDHAGSSPSVAEDADGNGIVVSIGADGMVYAFGPAAAEVLFEGTVTLTNGTTFTYVPFNNASASYEVNSTTDIGALTATGLAFNTSDSWYELYGTFWLESIAGIENEVWPNNTWCIYINDAPAPKGLGGNELEDGDNVKFYFCPANATTYAYITGDASYLVNITVNAIPDILFDGTVTLTNGTTFTYVPFNNASASYEVNSTTDIGALTATGLAFNTSDSWYELYGTFWLESIAGIENKVWPNNTWCIYINDAPAPKGLGGNELEDGDNVKFYFCPANATTYAYITGDASYLVNITVNAIPDILFDGTVTLTNGTTFTYVPSNNASASYEVNSTTDIGALTATGLAFNTSDSWYELYGSFWLESIAGIENEVWPNNTWCIYINDAPAPKGLGGNELEDGDNVKFYFCPANATTYAYITGDASYLVNITVSVTLRKGDANHDGSITAADASTVLQMAVGSIPPNDEADMNCDGRVTSLDALMILQTTAW